MAIIEVTLPKWGLTMEEGALVEWMVQEGQVVSAGQSIATVETDKVSNELESPVNGVVSKLMFAAGAEAIPVGAVLCTIEET
ncbi:MAG: biotin/lipoyl-binding protein [Anaerolineaceae bacterium]|nr:biotin/lipoyl-binding protein [Anaerolineaceae bacterium]